MLQILQNKFFLRKLDKFYEKLKQFYYFDDTIVNRFLKLVE